MRAGEERDVHEVDLHGDAAGLADVARVTCEAEASDVGAGVGVHRRHGLGGCAVQGRHLFDRGLHRLGVDAAALGGGGHGAHADGLREVERVADLGARVRHEALALDHARDREAKEALLRLGRMAASDDTAGLLHRGEAPSEDLGDPLVGEVAREAGEVEG